MSKVVVMKNKCKVIFENLRGFYFDHISPSDRDKVFLSVILKDGTEIRDEQIDDVRIQVSRKFVDKFEKDEREKGFKVEVTFKFGNNDTPSKRKFLDRQAVMEWVKASGASLDIIEVKDLGGGENVS